jgi:hypothetical protein
LPAAHRWRRRTASGDTLPAALIHVDDGEMTPGILHPQRLAWDGARAFVALAGTDEEYFWLGGRLRELLGAEFELALSDTHTRLVWQLRENAVSVEAGLWRARLADLLAERPQLCPAVRRLIDEARARADAEYAAFA